MPTTTADNTRLSPYDTWMMLNAAAWCHRLSATITHATCEENQHYSAKKCGDLRCQGCGGLEHQVAPQLAQIRHPLELDGGGDTTAAESISGFAALNNVIDGLYDNPTAADEFIDVEIDLSDEQLLQLFPELAGGDEITEEEERRFKEYQTEAPRREVYRGSCQRCGGFMDNVREFQDNNVWRCLACGWRDGREYRQNRKIHATEGIR